MTRIARRLRFRKAKSYLGAPIGREGRRWHKSVMQVSLAALCVVLTSRQVGLCGIDVRTTAETGAAAADEGTGPEIVWFGLLQADATVVHPSGVDGNGRPIYERPLGFGFSLVVEARPGQSGEAIGVAPFAEGGCPDLQIQVARPLGDGSEVVCDAAPPGVGGVPAIDPPVLEGDPSLCDALNDLGCRFVDGAGNPHKRSCSEEGCVRLPSGEFGCARAAATAQFCGLISKILELPTGDTLVTARVRDVAGNLGPPAQIIIRIADTRVTALPTLSPTFTPIPTHTTVPNPTDTQVSACNGDCNGDGEITVNELVTGVNIALGNVSVCECMPCDTNEDDLISIAELIKAVNRALTGCPFWNAGGLGEGGDLQASRAAWLEGSRHRCEERLGSRELPR